MVFHPNHTSPIKPEPVAGEKISFPHAIEKAFALPQTTPRTPSEIEAHNALIQTLLQNVRKLGDEQIRRGQMQSVVRDMRQRLSNIQLVCRSESPCPQSTPPRLVGLESYNHPARYSGDEPGKLEAWFEEMDGFVEETREQDEDGREVIMYYVAQLTRGAWDHIYGMGTHKFKTVDEIKVALRRRYGS